MVSLTILARYEAKIATLSFSLMGSFYLENFHEQLLKSRCNLILRLLDTFASKIAKICNFWAFRLVIQLIDQLFFSDFEKMVY